MILFPEPGREKSGNPGFRSGIYRNLSESVPTHAQGCPKWFGIICATKTSLSANILTENIHFLSKILENLPKPTVDALYSPCRDFDSKSTNLDFWHLGTVGKRSPDCKIRSKPFNTIHKPWFCRTESSESSSSWYGGPVDSASDMMISGSPRLPYAPRRRPEPNFNQNHDFLWICDAKNN